MEITMQVPEEKEKQKEADPKLSDKDTELNFLTLVDNDKKDKDVHLEDLKKYEPSAEYTRLNDARANLSDSLSHFKNEDPVAYAKFKTLPNNADGSFTKQQMEFLKEQAPLAFKPSVEFNDALKAFIKADKAGTTIEELERKAQPLETMKEVPPSAVEKIIGKGLAAAVESGNLAEARELLQNVQQMGPEASRRILRSFATQMEKLDTANLTTVRWESGKTDQGDEFVRVRIHIMDSNSKSSGGHTINLATDRLESATYQSQWNSKPIEVDPGRAFLNAIANRKAVFLTEEELSQSRKPFFYNKPLPSDYKK